MIEYQYIRTPQDADRFIEDVNGLHDGYVTHFEFVNDGVLQCDDGLFFDYSKVVLKMKVFVTSLEGHPTVEIIFRNVHRVQFYSFHFSDICDSSFAFREHSIIWADSHAADEELLVNCTFCEAESIAWRWND
ncbi:MAG: hypothetical protein IJW98_04970 [Clostridia bacterium]|nr:hypothetical protein [Clostridia bacterium]